MQSFKKHLEEKLKASDDMGDWVKDFQKSDAPQFKGKSQKKRQQMAVAAKLAAERNEEVELDEAEMSLYDKIKAARANPSPDKPVRGRGSKNRNPKAYDVHNALDKEDDRIQAMVKKKLKKEEVELDEVLDTPKAMDSYKAKAKYSKERAANSAAAKILRGKNADGERADHSPELKTMAKREKGLKMADKNAMKKTFKKLRGEEVNLSEVSTEKLRDYASAALQDKNKEKADKRWKYASKAMDTVADREVKAAHARKYNKMEEVELDEQTQYDLVEAYLLENNIDVDALSVEQLDEIIGKVVGGAFKVGAKAAVGAARGVKKAANRMTLAGRADAAEKRADAAEKRNKDRERIEKARNRLRDAQNAARDNQTQN